MRQSAFVGCHPGKPMQRLSSMPPCHTSLSRPNTQIGRTTIPIHGHQNAPKASVYVAAKSLQPVFQDSTSRLHIPSPLACLLAQPLGAHIITTHHKHAQTRARADARVLYPPTQRPMQFLLCLPHNTIRPHNNMHAAVRTHVPLGRDRPHF